MRATFSKGDNTPVPRKELDVVDISFIAKKGYLNLA
jgi:hypothetical protein